ncbi:MAG: hypothetical protein KBT35_04655 [Firmicutes bacterium]|nr:hypothetical protein [Candidatus Colivicinus equi]
MKDNKENVLEEKELDTIEGGGKPWGTWVPVDEECPDFDNSRGCPFRSFERRFDNCGACRNKDDQ